MNRREFIGSATVFAALGRAFGADKVKMVDGYPEWLMPQIDAALARYLKWKGTDETVSFTITTDLHDWHPDIDPKFGFDKSQKMHIPFALLAGEKFGTDFAADLGDIGSDIYLDENGKMHSATREIQRRRWQSQYDLYDKTKKPVFCCVGNHDLGHRKDEKGSRVEPSEFGEFFAPLAHGAQVVWGEGKHYGYWDVPNKNFRVIVLDDIDWGHSYGFKKPQLEFLAQRALRVPAGFTVLVMMHADLQPAFGCWLNKGVMHYRDRCNGFYAKMGVKEGLRMFEDFVAHGKGTSGGVSWDFTDLKDNRLACVLQGHSHYDNWFKQFDVLYLVRQGHGSLGTDTEMPHENGARHKWAWLPGDTCIDVVAVKPKTGALGIFRIGAGNEKADFLGV